MSKAGCRLFQPRLGKGSGGSSAAATVEALPAQFQRKKDQRALGDRVVPTTGLLLRNLNQIGNPRFPLKGSLKGDIDMSGGDENYFIWKRTFRET